MPGRERGLLLPLHADGSFAPGARELALAPLRARFADLNIEAVSRPASAFTCCSAPTRAARSTRPSTTRCSTSRTADSYAYGRCSAAVLGVVSASGVLQAWLPLAGAPKVEGVALAGDQLLMVTDADDPARASQLLRLAWPPPAGA